MVNLNKKVVTKEGILEYITDVEIFHFYSGKEVVLRQVMHSPIREDKNPSFGYFMSNGEVLFNDFVTGGGDCISFVSLLFGCTYFEALSQIVIDFKLSNYFYFKDRDYFNSNINKNNLQSKSLLKKVSQNEFKIKSREWCNLDRLYFTSYHISKKTLLKYRVIPIKYLFINNSIFTMDRNAYAFKEYKDNKQTLRIYQPYNKEYKWFNNHNYSVWQGWDQLPLKGDILIITSSLKDVMSIHDTIGIPSVALQAESVVPKESVINELYDRFKYIYIFYDNDQDKEENWGQKHANNLVDKFKFINIKIPNKYNCSDYSDLVKKFGKNKSINILNKLIKNGRKNK